jgi:excisionase family DNA binding protein
MTDGVPQVLTLPEVATLLRCSTDEVMGLVEEGLLHPVQLPRKYRFRADEVKRMLDDAGLPTPEDDSTGSRLGR